MGLAPLLGMELPSTEQFPPKEIENKLPDGTIKTVPNPEFTAAVQNLGEEMLTLLPKIKLRIATATDAAEGLNVLYENLRRQRSLNFANEVISPKN